MAFLPDDYKVPETGNYMKLVSGDNRFRILSKPIVGWLDWKDKKPLRFTMDARPESPVDPKKPIKHFWAFVVWNYASERVQVLEVHQQGIQKAIKAMDDSPEWGDPVNYDIKVNKEGQGMETEYTVTPLPPKPLMPEIAELFGKMTVNLDKLFANGDPFSVTPF